MPIERVHSFLVHPAKHLEDPPEIHGTQIPLHGTLFAMLRQVYERANEECNIEIVFKPDERGNNECRDLVVGYASRPGLPAGRHIASRLQSVTTHRSGLGLLFLMTGRDGEEHRLVLSRFPADQGILAEEEAAGLTVQFVERIFMKSATAYKSALYVSDSFERGFWDGSAVDRQIKGAREASDYWIKEFLASDFRTTGPLGTKRLAKALADAVRDTTELGVRQELIAAATLLRGQADQVITARDAVRQLRLSDRASEAVEAAFPHPHLMDEAFLFDQAEFDQHVRYRAVELDNGGLLVAEETRFGQVFRMEVVDPEADRRRYVTEGRVIDERLRKVK